MNVLQFQNEITLTWSIKNFSHCPQQQCQYLCSPTFYTKNFYGATWRLLLFPRGSSESKIKHIACNLDVSWPDNASDSLPIKLELGIIDENGLCQKAVSTKDSPFWRDTVLRCPNLIEREHLFRNKDSFLPKDTLTIRCYILGQSFIKSTSIQYFARTTFEVERCFFQWALKDFSVWDTNKSLCIPIPLTSKMEAVTYFSKLNASGEQIAVDIRQSVPENYSRYFICKISVCDAERNTRESHLQEYLLRANDINVKTILLCPKEKIMKRKHLYIRDDTLNLQCEFSISSGEPKNSPITNSKQLKTILTNPAFIDTLRMDLQRMYEEKKFTDVVLKADDELFSAHKAVLSVRSPVFKAMFEQDMTENQSGHVDIFDINASTLNNLLKYMYSSSLEICDCEGICQLLLAADKYQILELRELCILVLKSNLSIESVCQILVLADFHGIMDLKEAAVEFILENRCEVLQSNEWLQFIEGHLLLSTEIFKYLSTNLNHSS